MTYQVIARKWRPQNFDELIGQDHISETLKNAILNDRVGHAFLFTGVRGVGKTTTARILAKRLNCENPQGGNPCNKCSSCVDVQAGKHIDIIEIDGASNTGVDDVKVLREAAKYLPSRGKYKIYIIDEVHMLSEKAFNALLKTLEEPPSHVKFIFATTDPHKIPVTIKSRCQIYDFKAISLDLIFNQLKHILDSENIKYEDAALYLVSKKAEGSMRDAQSLLEQVISFASNNITKNDVLNILGVTDSDILFDMTDAIIEHRVENIILITDKLISSGINLIHFYKELIEHFHGILVASKVKNPYKILKMPEFEIKRYIQQAQRFDNNFTKLYQMLINGFELLKTSQFQRVTFEMNLIKLANYEPVTPLNDILNFINKLANTFDKQPEAKNIEISLFNVINSEKKSKNVLPEIKKQDEFLKNGEKNEKKDKYVPPEITEEKKNNNIEDKQEKQNIEAVKKNLPEKIDFDDYQKLFESFFNDEDESYRYFYIQTKLPVEFKDGVLVIEYDDAETLFKLHPNFQKKYETWIRNHFNNVEEVKFNLLSKNDKKTFEAIKNIKINERNKKEIEEIKNLNGVNKVKKAFKLKVKNIKKL